MANILKTAANSLLLVLGARMLDRIINRKKDDRHCPDPDVTVDRSTLKYIPTQLVVWKKPGVPDADFNAWKAALLQQYSGLIVKKLCRSCDDSLELWEGDNVTTLISEKVVKGGSTSTGAPPSGGGDAIASFSYNLIIDLPEQQACMPARGREPQTTPRPGRSDPALVVAVFDTGLMAPLKDAASEPVPSCMPNGEKGWNFAYKNNLTDDDYPSHHGSAVTRFILDQEDQYRRQKINILPVKIHNSYGKSDLFSILCGFAYAANCGAKIVNASFGFYAAKNAEPPAILAQFVKKHLTDNNILLITAAGNVNADKIVGQPVTDTIRNLEYHPFFPACLAKNFENVLAVTTVSLDEGKVSPSQNFSNLVVDVGVACDAVLEADYRFQDSLGSGMFIVGSSYATPIITGKIAQHYNELMAAMPYGVINKSILLQKLADLGIISTDSRFNAYVRDGNVSKK